MPSREHHMNCRTQKGGKCDCWHRTDWPNCLSRARLILAALAERGYRLASASEVLPSAEVAVGDLDAAWAAAEAALGPQQRLVMWQDREGPIYVQVLEPEPPACEHEDENTMAPVITRLAAYPSKNLGNLVEELHSVAAQLQAGRKEPGRE